MEIIEYLNPAHTWQHIPMDIVKKAAMTVIEIYDKHRNVSFLSTAAYHFAI